MELNQAVAMLALVLQILALAVALLTMGLLLRVAAGRVWLSFVTRAHNQHLVA